MSTVMRKTHLSIFCHHVFLPTTTNTSLSPPPPSPTHSSPHHSPTQHQHTSLQPHHHLHLQYLCRSLQSPSSIWHKNTSPTPLSTPSIHMELCAAAGTNWIDLRIIVDCYGRVCGKML